MTTITIECELLEQALEALELATEDYDDSAVGIEIESIHSLRAALSAPATAPEPSWQDAPTVPGLWVSDFSWMAQKLGRETVEFYAKNRSIPSRRWYGPIPEDKQ